jgi:hypothetical protein
MVSYAKYIRMYVSTKKYFDSVDSEDLKKTWKTAFLISTAIAISYFGTIYRIGQLNNFGGLYMLIWVLFAIASVTVLTISVISAITLYFHSFIWLYFGRKGISKTFKGIIHSSIPFVVVLFISNVLLLISGHVFMVVFVAILLIAAFSYFLYLLRTAVMVMHGFFSSKALKAVIIAPLGTLAAIWIVYLIALYIFLK